MNCIFGWFTLIYFDMPFHVCSTPSEGVDHLYIGTCGLCGPGYYNDGYYCI